MLTMNEAASLDLRERFPNRDWSRCSLGVPTGAGLRIGYEGWGDPDVALNPALPVDMCLGKLSPRSFSIVESSGLLNVTHGDCMLTHAANGIMSLVVPGGLARVSFLVTSEIARDALALLDVMAIDKAQALEKLCFGPPLDLGGVVYPQNLMTVNRAVALLFHAGARSVKVTKKPSAPDHYFPDEVRLEGISGQDWKRSRGYLRMREGLFANRPTCLLCERVVTKRDHDRSFFSCYCADHYQVARVMHDEDVRKCYSAILEATK